MTVNTFFFVILSKQSAAKDLFSPEQAKRSEGPFSFVLLNAPFVSLNEAKDLLNRHSIIQRG